MLLSSLVALVPFVLNTNAFLFEPPSSSTVKRHITHHRRVAGSVSHSRRGPGDQWTFAGCRTDSVGTRALQGATFASGTMTNDACQTFCDQAGFTIAATEWSQECWCDNDFQFGDTALPEECDHMCSGNPTEVCGGSGRLTVWTKSSTATVLESYGDWTSQGCFIDSMAARVVPVFMPLDAPFTPQRCLDACSSSGYLYAGLEYRLECYCANSVDIASLTSTPIEECASTCEGDASHYCGAGNRLILYQKPENAPISYGDWTGKGCYTDSIGDRVLPNRVYVDGAMTIEKCTNKCLESGFPYAGVEFGDVSHCGNSIGASGSPATDGCTMACSGASDQNCGGGNRLNLFQRTDATTPMIAPANPGWTYQDCYTDTNDNRALGLRIWLDRGMTAPACMDGCFQRGYQFAGVEYADECYCANSIGSSGAVATGGCEMACSGDSATLCGGAGRLNVYKYTGSDLPVAPSVLESYNNYNSQGCYTDAVVSRVLTPQSVSDSMTVETCIDACSAASYSVAGLEYGNECYCGNALPATQATDNCIMNCAGDGEHVCGGPDRLSVYEKQPEQEPEPEPESQWEYFGCRETNPYSKMEFDDTHQTTMTPQLCTSYCDSKSLNVAILVTGGTCVCQPHYGNDLGSACTKPCPGDLTQKCGTTSTFGGSVWIKPPTSVVMVSAPVQNVWSSAGCYSASGAVYWARIYQFNSMTVNYCTNFCYGKGLPIAAISTVPSSSTYPICGRYYLP
ncbi:hypothetical protein FRB91_010530 [Serendipita sp. 411]|nr:hypothetical protein FRC18_002559 [Serendipita sp. 400]KAG8848732.1 hypothetical protein FRB91_010530 [Serendipita sp. 411]